MNAERSALRELTRLSIVTLQQLDVAVLGLLTAPNTEQSGELCTPKLALVEVQGKMKTLFLLRHAKSSWDNPKLKDFERPLSERGINDAPVLADRFLSRNNSVECIICSPAMRAKSTAKLFAENINFPVDDIISNPELYFAGVSMFLKAASLVDANCESAMLVGHNPAITDFVNDMANTDIENIPTCGLVELRLPIEHWSDIEAGDAELVEFDYPKKRY